MISGYPNCLDRREEVANARIDAILAGHRETLHFDLGAVLPAKGGGVDPAGQSRDDEPLMGSAPGTKPQVRRARIVA
jgi:hypothetical protein